MFTYEQKIIRLSIVCAYPYPELIKTFHLIKEFFLHVCFHTSISKALELIVIALSSF